MTDQDLAKIAADKEAVKSMIGAKSAMQSALDRIAFLEGTLRQTNTINGELYRCIGEGVLLHTHHHGNFGAYVSDKKPVPVSQLREWSEYLVKQAISH